MKLLRSALFSLVVLMLILSSCAAVQPANPQTVYSFGAAKYSELSGSWPSSITQWKAEINTAAKTSDLPANLLAAIIIRESNGKEKAVAKSGFGIGLMQLIPSTAKLTPNKGYENCFKDQYTKEDLLVAKINLKAGSGKLRCFADVNNGDLSKAVTGYGPMYPKDYYLKMIYETYTKYSK